MRPKQLFFDHSLHGYDQKHAGVVFLLEFLRAEKNQDDLGRGDISEGRA
jgi:hypothetical protein